VVIEHVQDLDVGPVREAPVGGVGLPALVRQLGTKAPPGAAGALVGLGDDKAPPGQHPPDRGHRRHLLAGLSPPVPEEVVLDRVRPGVEALLAQGLAQCDDLVLDRL